MSFIQVFFEIQLKWREKIEQNLIVGIQERPKSVLKWLMLSLQHVFAMFGATVLVPLLTGLDVGVALVASGVGTLIYIACTKGKVPVYLGSMRNIIIVASMLVIGLGGAGFALNSAVDLTGMSLAAVLGIIHNLILPKEKEID